MSVSATYVIQAYLGGVWTTLTRQVGQITGSWGISRNGPIDFLAGTGTLRFMLRNADGLYSPGNAAVISSDWKKGCPVRIVFTYDGASRAWYGAIDNFSFEPDALHNSQIATVYTVDFMDKAAKYPLDYPDIQLEQRADQVVQTVLDAMPIAPLEQDLATGVNTFPVVFDTVTDFTKASKEFNKVLLSELCYMYVRHGGSLGEKLVLENANTRAAATPKVIAVLGTDAGFLLMEDGSYLLLETGDKIVLDLSQAFTASNDFISDDVSFGDNVINDITFRYIPKSYILVGVNTGLYFPYVSNAQTRQDGLGIFGSLSLAAGETKTIFSKWGSFNTSGYAGGSSPFRNTPEQRLLVAPPFPTAISNTAGGMNTTPTFDGSDITANLELISLETWFDKFKIVIKNNGVSNGFPVFVLAGSYATALITCDPEILVHISDAASILTNDTQPLQFDQPYQIDATVGTAFANNVLAIESNPRTVLNKITYCANRSSYYMNAFMSLDVGDLIPVVDTNKAINGRYFIQNMSFTVDPGGVIWFSPGLKQDQYHAGASTTTTAPTFVSANSQTGNGVSSITWSHTIAEGINRLLVVEVAAKGTKSVSAVTYGSQSLTLKSTAQFGTADDEPKVELWYLVNPPVGTATITVTTTANSQLEAGSINFTNVHQYSPFGTFVSASGTGTTASVTAAGATNDLIIDIVSTYAALTVGAGQTSRWSGSADGAWRGAGSTEPGAASVVMSWTVGSSQKWCIGAVALKAA